MNQKAIKTRIARQAPILREGDLLRSTTILDRDDGGVFSAGTEFLVTRLEAGIGQTVHLKATADQRPASVNRLDLWKWFERAVE